MGEEEWKQAYYVDSRKPRYRLYIMLLIVGVIVVSAFAIN